MNNHHVPWGVNPAKNESVGLNGQPLVAPSASSPTDSDASQHIAYWAACGGITMGMQASGLYEGLIFDLPQTCPNCDQPTEIITWAEWQSREGLVPPTAPPSPTN